jgi:hypothetical protein
MYSKQPVTQREHVLSDKGVLISHNDLKRHVICADPALVEIDPPELKAMGS